ncbi:kinase-like domain-containing protein [Polychytrium aggregatum]|uniref:kinase-like domain-containing protein n=1 Tax=Polychytrium aggregatum TaxID=110093 RepID=UPI0022FEF41A|nr:kinase-like domain-containing protein [Polychytrium aggregatum]KAI9193316.1 kinase-like domain-containing protein [Polychytrium aggregatum]
MDKQSATLSKASEPPAPSNIANRPGTPGSAEANGPGQGMLLIRIVEAKNLPGCSFSDKDPAKLPYCVIEVDKNDLVVPAKEALNGIVTWQYRSHFDVSRQCDITLSVYHKTAAGDKMLGSVVVNHNFTDQNLNDGWYALTSQDDGKPAGELHLQLVFKRAAKKPMSIEDFDLLKVIGKGSFGKVMQVRKKDTNRIYAMKIIKKSHIVERSEVSHTLAERMVLARINHPFVVPLKFSFQSPEKLYLVLAFVNGGELFHHLQNEGRFAEERAKFYTAELLTALECLHNYDIIYRDLKPENILLDYTGHIALCDFGLCKLNMKDGNKTNTFCGTPEYLAPELLINKGYTKVVDWWTLGILLYEMLVGLPPFYDENVNEMYRKILSDELKFPDDMSSQAKDILRQAKRLGRNGPEEIKQHPFFANINWQKLYLRKYTPPFRPNVASATDTSNFDTEFTSEIPMDSVSEGSALSQSVQQQFQGFTYQATQEHLAGSLQATGSLIAPSRLGGALPSNRPTQPLRK